MCALFELSLIENVTEGWEAGLVEDRLLPLPARRVLSDKNPRDTGS
jgi:hypothetical protein